MSAYCELYARRIHDVNQSNILLYFKPFTADDESQPSISGQADSYFGIVVGAVGNWKKISYINES